MPSNSETLKRPRNSLKQRNILYKEGDSILVIKGVPPRFLVPIAFWISAGAAAVTLALTLHASDYLPALLLVLMSLFVFSFLMTKRTYIEINRAMGMVQRKWTVLLFNGSAIHPLRDFHSVDMEEKRQNIEGYSIPVYTLLLVGTGKKLELISTDDLTDARELQAEIAQFTGLSVNDNRTIIKDRVQY